MTRSTGVGKGGNAKPKDHTGERFGRLTAVELAPRQPKKPRQWVCMCDCGKTVNVYASSLVTGNTRSCGCLFAEVLKVASVTHGRSHTPEHTAWRGMWQRCTNPNHPNYPTYSCRTPPDAWRSFEVFLSDVGFKPTPQHTLERIDNDKPYSKENCQWATRSEQSQNQSHTVRVLFQGQPMSLSKACREAGLVYPTVKDRLQRGWSLQEASHKLFTYQEGYIPPPIQTRHNQPLVKESTHS